METTPYFKFAVAVEAFDMLLCDYFVQVGRCGHSWHNARMRVLTDDFDGYRDELSNLEKLAETLAPNCPPACPCPIVAGYDTWTMAILVPFRDR